MARDLIKAAADEMMVPRDKYIGRRLGAPPKDQSEQSDNGESGAPSPATSSKGFQIYIPLEQGEKNPSGGEAGKAAPKERKG